MSDKLRLTTEEYAQWAAENLEIVDNGRADTVATDNRLLDGISFAEEVGHVGEALCGEGEQVLWQKGEPLMLYGPQGVGKTTVAQRMTLGRAGVDPVLLGLPVIASERPILYVAADRPAQAARSWRRMVAQLDEDQRLLVRERVRFWRGPLPFDIGSEPDKLLGFVLELGVGTFIGDSLKDLAMDLSKEEPAARVNRAWQLLISNGVEVLDLHHPRKSVAGQTSKPRDLDEVYGNTWLTAGHGSIVLLWGRPGDPIVELSHLKQPFEEVGPFRVIVDHELGMVERYDGGDLLGILRTARQGLTAKESACVLFSTAKPTDSEVEKARRRLEKLVHRGLAMPRRGGRGERGRVQPTTYLAAAPAGVQEEL